MWFDLEHVWNRKKGDGSDAIDLKVLWRLTKIHAWSIYACNIKFVAMMMVWSKYSDVGQDMGLTDSLNYNEDLIQ